MTKAPNSDEPIDLMVALSEDAAAAVADEARARTDLAAAIVQLLDRSGTNDPEDRYERYLTGVAARVDLDLDAAVNPVAGWWIEKDGYGDLTVWRPDPARSWQPIPVAVEYSASDELWALLAALVPVRDTTEDEDEDEDEGEGDL